MQLRVRHEQIGERQYPPRCGEPMASVRFSRDDVDADDRIGPAELLGRLEPAAVNLKRRDQMIGCEM